MNVNSTFIVGYNLTSTVAEVADAFLSKIRILRHICNFKKFSLRHRILTYQLCFAPISHIYSINTGLTHKKKLAWLVA